MSGVEILGIAAGVVQLADLGARLSVNLYTFSRKVKDANKEIDSLCNDIAGTGAVLKTLGEQIKTDLDPRLFKNETIIQAQRLMNDCKGLYDEINEAIDRHGKDDDDSSADKGKSAEIPGPPGMRRLWTKVRWPFVQGKIKALKSRLGYLKAELMLMLQGLILVALARRHEDWDVMQEQHALVYELWTEQKKALALAQFHEDVDMLDRPAAVESQGLSPPTDFAAASSLAERPTSGVPVESMAPLRPMAAMTVVDYRPPSLPENLHDERAEQIFDHCRLVETLLKQVGDHNWRVTQDIRAKTGDKILQAHYMQWRRHFHHHDDTVKFKYFERFPNLEHYYYWQDQDRAFAAAEETKEMGRDTWVRGHQEREPEPAQLPRGSRQGVARSTPRFRHEYKSFSQNERPTNRSRDHMSREGADVDAPLQARVSPAPPSPDRRTTPQSERLPDEISLPNRTLGVQAGDMSEASRSSRTASAVSRGLHRERSVRDMDDRTTFPDEGPETQSDTSDYDAEGEALEHESLNMMEALEPDSFNMMEALEPESFNMMEALEPDSFNMMEARSRDISRDHLIQDLVSQTTFPNEGSEAESNTRGYGGDAAAGAKVEGGLKQQLKEYLQHYTTMTDEEWSYLEEL
ncbi:hypothetical protein HRR83_009505 [Exophiala dermatitidis]|nr:hypothetical protein HRR75_008247 [Exophiala dermatitidis]KAJ4504331.1 hypothetical protein HRR74_008977 [Exophiala dermatitidis]KAJ4504899.1 hypothetical protein HRR73_008653 [Exophiala dermatitidis]KAJ4551173.1 hypothetical protein HRR78_003849 [Exophiala dermatitidis]KAJ4585196.1 hypothetical protein HRR81_001005 [Exophiala dermatitidis]